MHRSWMALTALLGVVAPNLGCGNTACFQWSAAEGSCPDRQKAQTFFGTCNDIASIDDDGKFANNLCCYSVTKNGNNVDTLGCSDTVGTGVSPGAIAVTTVGFVSSSASVGPGQCDGFHMCGDAASGCMGCALNGPCATQLDACSSTLDCNQYSACVSACPQQMPACIMQCESQHPAGATLYNNLAECTICKACPMDCASMSQICGGNPSSSSSSGGGGGAGGASSSSGMGGMGGKP